MASPDPQYGYMVTGLISEDVISTGTVLADEIDSAVSDVIIQTFGPRAAREPLTIESRSVTYVVTPEKGERALVTVFLQPIDKTDKKVAERLKRNQFGIERTS